MHRRTAIASIGSLLVAGCLSNDASPGGSSEEPTETTTPTPTEAPTTATPSDTPPEPELDFRYEGQNTVTLVHFGGEEVTDERTTKLFVEVDGQHVPVVRHNDEFAYWLADDSSMDEGEAAAYHYPLSVGNVVTVSAEPGSVVDVVWVATDGTEAVIGTYDVPTEATSE